MRDGLDEISRLGIRRLNRDAALGKVDLHLGVVVDAVHRSRDDSGAMAAGHIFNLVDRHGVLRGEKVQAVWTLLLWEGQAAPSFHSKNLEVPVSHAPVSRLEKSSLCGQ
jgi:hypothetical protein